MQRHYQDRDLVARYFHMGDNTGIEDEFKNRLSVSVTVTETGFLLDGEKDDIERGFSALGRLSALNRGGEVITAKSVLDSINAVKGSDAARYAAEIAPEFAAAANGGKSSPRPQRQSNFSIKPRNEGQMEFMRALENSNLTFGLGPAGTGKTLLAVAKALEALQKGEVDKIVLSRPAIEAGEKLGFLPGGVKDKVEPFLMPLIDSLDLILGEGAPSTGKAKRENLERTGKIEIIPIAFMRGRTFVNSFVILDEAQNATYEQLKMAVTRPGEGSKMAIVGDPMQNDLGNEGKQSGLLPIHNMLKDVAGVATVALSKVERSGFQAEIVDALIRGEGGLNKAPANDMTLTPTPRMKSRALPKLPDLP